MASKQYIFGSGNLFGTRTDVANSTPTLFGVLQDVQLDFSFDNKELYGQSQFPVAVARGQGKITGKAKAAQFNGRAYNDLFYGEATLPTGQTLVSANEAGTVPATPFKITVTNTSTFVDDLGVIGVLSAQPLKKVAASPATGQYSVTNAGVYEFAAADTTLAMFISYSYTAATGVTMTITNKVMGSQPVFSIVLQQVFNSQAYTVKLNQCVSTKLSFPFKNDSFAMMDFDWSSFADASGNLGTVSLTNA